MTFETASLLPVRAGITSKKIFSKRYIKGTDFHLPDSLEKDERTVAVRFQMTELIYVTALCMIIFVFEYDIRSTD